MEVNFLDGLNEAQLEAVKCINGASIVIAGAGSGKTRMLTYKIAYLISQGVKPYNILALTFTNKAANEMKERIASIVGQDNAHYINMGTFHSIFSRILRAEAATCGYTSNYTIYDESDSKAVVKRVMGDLLLDEKNYKPSSVYNFISMAKNHLILNDEYNSNSNIRERDNSLKIPKMGMIYDLYQKKLKESNAMDFDDLLVNTYLLFKNNEDIRKKYTNMFQYILVDEYQDTNHAQQITVYQISKDHQNICVVGDDAQSIYAFRGANLDNMLNFKQYYPNVKTFKLEQNYRSTQNIVNAANCLIKHNKRQINKDVFSNNDIGSKLICNTLETDRDEASFVCNQINKLIKTTSQSYSKFAILYRTNSQSRSFEEELGKCGIPYRIYGGLGFYQRKEIKDIIAYLRVISNHDDEVSLRRIINYPARAIGATTINKLSAIATQEGVCMWKIIENVSLYSDILGKAKTKVILNFVDLINNLSQISQKEDVYKTSLKLIELSEIDKELSSNISAEDISRKENVEELLNRMAEFVETRNREKNENVSVNNFLEEVSLIADNNNKEIQTEHVSLITMHGAKGLEYDNVFIVGLEENIIPSPQAYSIKEIEEERRLMYVAITRAKTICYLTCAQRRYRFGSITFNNKSRFIEEIGDNFIELYSPMNSHTAQYKSFETHKHNSVKPLNNNIETKLKPIKCENLITQSSITTNSGKIEIGTKIKHDRFGVGLIKNIEGEGENCKITVSFDEVGSKQLLLKFARFKII